MDFAESEHAADGEMEDSEDEVRTQAHKAAATGDIDVLSRAIQADPSILEQQDAEGLTPLAHATTGQQLESVKLLVKMGASINAQDNLGRTCLIIAAYQGWLEGAVFLMRNGSKQSIADKCGRTPLHSATYDTDTRVLATLLQRLRAGDINQQDNEGMTALHWATFHDRPNHVNLLLSKNADMFVQDIDGKTALHWASQNGSKTCCRLLCKMPDGIVLVNQSDYSGKNAIHLAAAAGHCEVLKELASTPGCDLEVEDPDERTPLHWSAATGQANAVNTLLELNVNPNPIDIEGSTPLDYAQQSDHRECVRILEQSLGLQQRVPDDVNPTSGLQSSDSPASRSRRNPLGFIADFFRSRKAGTRDPCSSPSEHTKDLFSGSAMAQQHSESPQSSSDETNQNNNTLTTAMHLSINGETTTSSNNNRSLSSEDSSEDSLEMSLSHDQNMIQSIAKLQLSRQDNPTLQKHGFHLSQSMDLTPVKKGHSRGAAAAVVVDTTHAQVHASCVSTPRRKVLPPLNVDVQKCKTPPAEHSLLIRSPPPMLKTSGNFSPTMSRENTLLDRENSRAQAEDDLADILALQGAVPAKQRVGISLSDSSVEGSTYQTWQRETVTHTASAGAAPPLAPLRGQVPKMSASPAPRQVELLRQERSGANRSPTPPVPAGWHHSPLASRHDQPQEPSPPTERKNKRKKRGTAAKQKLLQQRSDTPKSSNSDDTPHKKKTSLKVKKAESQNKPNAPTAYEQRLALDKSIAHLLH